jgi:hypothetical protein
VVVDRADRLDAQPRLIEDVDDLFRERALLQIRQVLLEVRLARCADQDIVPVLAGHEGVVRNPAKGDLYERHWDQYTRDNEVKPAANLSQSEIVLVSDGLDELEGVKVAVVPVSSAVCS